MGKRVAANGMSGNVPAGRSWRPRPDRRGRTVRLACQQRAMVARRALGDPREQRADASAPIAPTINTTLKRR